MHYEKKPYCEILGVSHAADFGVIRTAYLILVKQLHPDAKLGDKSGEDRLKEVNIAFEVLRNPELRDAYDSHPILPKLVEKAYAREKRQTTPERVAVISSNISFIGYDSEKRILEIVFKGNRVYQYFDVPLVVFNEFLQAPSKGKFFNKIILPRYNYRPI